MYRVCLLNCHLWGRELKSFPEKRTASIIGEFKSCCKQLWSVWCWFPFWVRGCIIQRLWMIGLIHLFNLLVESICHIFGYWFSLRLGCTHLNEPLRLYWDHSDRGSGHSWRESNGFANEHIYRQWILYLSLIMVPGAEDQMIESWHTCVSNNIWSLFVITNDRW